ncbi:pentapeptide repeat-containing protein [Streptomyces bottropensis]|uniref:pentapeptide repeat-containing protein n=1 Tax=Streptomyces bottropensis TaxID=42235 RepID=UPI00368263EA
MLEGMSARSLKSWTWVWGILTVLLGVGAFGVALWRVPWWMDEKYLPGLEPAQATAVTGVRTSLLALGAGGLAAVGIVYTHRTLHQNREGQVTDRYTKAIGQIASDKPVEQLGGIYALERIMRDSVKDHATIVEVLAAFVREHAPAPVTGPDEPAPITAPDEHSRQARRLDRLIGERIVDRDRRPTEPVQAALTVLGRRPRDRAEPFLVNLAHTDLRGAELGGGYLQEAVLFRADLEGASLHRAILSGARLEGANLVRTELPEAHLEGARLEKARLEEANLRGAYLDSALLPRAHLKDADLHGARLAGALGLTVEQLVSARPTRWTSLPANLAEDSEVMARIVAVMEEDAG